MTLVVRFIQFWRVRCLFAVMLAIAGVGHCLAADPPPVQSDLWQLVSKDVGLAVEIKGLSVETRKFLGSELFHRIQRHSTFQQLLRGKEVQDLQNVQQAVQSVTGQPLLSWLEKLIGQNILLSITPQAAGRPRVALLMRLKEPTDLPEILAAWSKLEPRTETRLEHQGRPYFRRIKADKPTEPLFHALINDVLVLSDQAESVTPIMDLALGPEHRGSVRNAPGFQKIAQSLHPASSIRLFVQPAALTQSRATQPTAADPVERAIQYAWNRCQAIGLGVRSDSGIVIELVVTSEELSREPLWQKLVARMDGAPAFLARVPRTAILAFAGRHGLGEVSDWVLSRTSAEQQKRWKSIRQLLSGVLLGNELLTDVLPQLPTDFGGYVVPRADRQPDAPPVEGLFALSLPSDEAATVKPGRPTLRASVDNALRTGISMLAALHNASSDAEATVEEGEQQGVKIHWIDNFGPIRPAYAIAPDSLLIASSPQVIREFLSQSPTDTWGTDERLQKLRETYIPDASQILALHSRFLASFLSQRREPLLKQLETLHKLDVDDAGKRLDRMLEWVQLSDIVVLATAFRTDHVKLVLAISVLEADPR